MLKNTLTIILDEGNYIYERGTICDLSTNETSKYIEIITDRNDSYEECINDKIAFKSSYNNTEDDFTYEEFFNEEFDVEIKGTKEDVLYFLNNNEINKKITLSGENNRELSIKDEEYINFLINNLNNTDNIYLKLEGNTNGINIEDYKYTINYINSIVEKIQSKELTPFEQLIYLYDIVRDRKYILEEDNESYTISRDLTEVIKGNKIVCAGFSEIFDKVSQKLGFNSKIQCLHNKELTSGHARNMVYIKDDKYNIDGIFVFDTTEGCKRDETNNHFNSYLFCARPKEFFEFADKKLKNDYIDDELNIINEVYNKVSNDDFDIDRELLIVFYSIYSHLRNIELKEIYKLNIKENQKNFKQKVIDFYKLFNQIISIDTYIEALTNVRIKEYIENEEKYPLSIEKLIEISPSTIEEIDEETSKKINRVRLSKTLRKVLNKKNNK